ncbi:AAA family ATPase [Paraburkholderia adhaesiva]|uniref:AAA family ATPase n=1 Tax=Paraburkholderia adhaesiva TaxID=2883244 RepID=UPI001F2F81A8|nr:AAA family ATPase [Paraburkholderia adhaesiva]
MLPNLALPTPTISASDIAEPINWLNLCGKEPPERSWLIDQLIPTGHVTSLYGRGSVGKTLSAMQMGACVALGKPAFGIDVTRGRVLGLFCEDDHDELWRRTHRLAQGLDSSLRDLAGWLDFHPRIGMDNVLATRGEGGIVRPEPLYASLVETLMTARSQERPYSFIILDNVAQMLAVQENDRAQVTQAVNLLSRVANQFDCAVLMLAHTAKVGTSEFSGSTAWENSVRSRLLLRRKDDEDMDQPSDEVLLSSRKANYAARGTVCLRYDEGFYRRTDGENADAFELIRQERLDEHAQSVLLNGLMHLQGLGIDASQSSRSVERYLPKLLIAQGLNDGCQLVELKAALTRALLDGTIIVQTKRDRRQAREVEYLTLA